MHAKSGLDKKKIFSSRLKKAMKGMKSAVRLLLGAGLRVGELMAATWADVDLARGTLDVRGDAIGTQLRRNCIR